VVDSPDLVRQQAAPIGPQGYKALVLITVAGGHGPYLLMAGLFVLTGVLGQVISNMATALIMIPIALSAAADIGVSLRPFLMLMTVAAAASFLTPIATPANTCLSSGS
jgi:di/tricarboxylate transporter